MYKQNRKQHQPELKSEELAHTVQATLFWTCYHNGLELLLSRMLL